MIGISLIPDTPLTPTHWPRQEIPKGGPKAERGMEDDWDYALT